VAYVELSLAAIERLDRMIVTHSLPVDTRERVQRSLRVLERFPSIGRELDERWGGLRVIVGPWRWLLIVYVYEQSVGRVLVVAIQDARSSAAVTNLMAPQ
jgi:plasmid stabilization system protein ParE